MAGACVGGGGLPEELLRLATRGGHGTPLLALSQANMPGPATIVRGGGDFRHRPKV